MQHSANKDSNCVNTFPLKLTKQSLVLLLKDCVFSKGCDCLVLRTCSINIIWWTSSYLTDTAAHGSDYNKPRSSSSRRSRRSDGAGAGSTTPKAATKSPLNDDQRREFEEGFIPKSRIPRTPDVRPTSRGNSGGVVPRPEYSDSLPLSRPNSGGRPSSE